MKVDDKIGFFQKFDQFLFEFWMFNHTKQHVLILNIISYISLFSSFGEACQLFTMHYNNLNGFHQNFDRLYNKQFQFVVSHNVHNKTCLNLSHFNTINWVPTFNCECLNMILLKCFFFFKFQINFFQCIWIEITNFNFFLVFILHMLALFIYPKRLRSKVKANFP